MAIDVTANIAANLPLIFASEGERLWNREAPLLSRVQIESGMGPSVQWTVTNGGNTAVNPGEGDDVQSSEFNEDDRVKLSLNRGIYRSSFGFTHTELATVASYMTTPEIAADLIRDRLKDAYLEALAKLANKIEQDMLTGTGTATSPLSASVNNIVGLLNALKASGTYAGQTLGGANTGLVANVQSGVGNVTRAVLDLAFAQIEQNTGTTPDFIMCSPSTARYIKGIGDTQVRFPQEVMQRELNQISSAPTSMGNSVVSYNGVPVFQNSAWYQAGGDGYVVIGRFQDLGINHLRYSSWGDAVSDREETTISSNGQEMRRVGPSCKVYSLAKTGSSVKFAVETELQMKVKAPNRFALLTGVTGFATS
jgi:hypothetical protein